MSVQENKALIQRYITELYNKGNLNVIDEFLAPNYVGSSAVQNIQGQESAKEVASAMLSAFPDLKFTFEDVLAEGNKVALRWTMKGTHKGEFQGIPQTGNRVEVTGISIIRIEDGKLVEGWTQQDALGLMQQLGVAEAPGQAS